ncbi:hypothetical protein HPULCUR_002750 [Helicostylum pulchrum]|uniref:Uncharacterized protein n=1 Tax=Helicostylum pulchrum TaxID=562976 RepID=A0ABP9XRM2_9FUNG
MSEISMKRGLGTPLTYSKEKLIKLYGIDIFAAISSSALVTPFIAVVDRSIIENLNGKRPLSEGIKYGFRSIVSHPFKFTLSPQFRLVLGLYFSTYATANIVDTTCEQYSVDPSKSSMYKFMATTVINMSLCIYKDKAFARMFGVAASHSMPKLTYFLFAARDSLTIAASFNAPAYITPLMRDSDWNVSEKTMSTVAQLLCPAVAQIFSTPVHLYALDLYNRPGATGTMRTQLIRKEYLKSTLARIGRIGPAFGVGGVGNSYARSLRNNVL